MLVQLIKPSWENKAYDNRNWLLTQIRWAQGRLSTIWLDCDKCQRQVDIPYGRGLLQGLWVCRDALLPMCLYPLAGGPTASGTLMGHTTTLSQSQLPSWWRASGGHLESLCDGGGLDHGKSGSCFKNQGIEIQGREKSFVSVTQECRVLANISEFSEALPNP